jgi:hypothetical protein
MSTTLARFHDWRRGSVEKEVVLTIPDIRKFQKLPIYPWLVMAANPHLSAPDISEFLGTGMAERPVPWLQKRRWMVGGARGVPKGQPADLDGKQGKAVRIMSENPGMSLRNLTRLLKDSGIVRGKDWVRRHRCDGLADD